MFKSISLQNDDEYDFKICSLFIYLFIWIINKRQNFITMTKFNEQLK